jgi:hypothetical protein
VIETFLPPAQRSPILQFSGDLNIADGLQDGYYVILGTRDDRNPLPSPLPALEVRDGILLADARPVTNLSYVLMDVRCLRARTRELNDAAAWDAKLRQAEAAVARVAGNPLTTADARSQAWQQCLNLLNEAQLLLLEDLNFLNREAQDIIKAAYAHCYQQAFGENASRGGLAAPRRDAPPPAELRASRSKLDIPEDEDIEVSLDRYADDVVDARQILRASGLM